MKDKTKVFLREYKTFRDYAQKHQIPDAEIPQLFAIFRKDERSAEINGFRNHDNGMVTSRQKAYIKRLTDNNGESKFTDEYIEGLSKEGASKLIDMLVGGGSNAAAPQ